MAEEYEIIARALKGDEKARTSLYRMKERNWFRLCLRYGRNRSEAQDILQDGLIRIFRDLAQFNPDKGSFSVWSNRVLVNAALRYLQKHQWQSAFEDLKTVEHCKVLDAGIIGRITARELTEVIQKLPSGYRIVFNMFEIEGFSHKEIANKLNISVGTSKSQLSKAKRMLRSQLEALFS